MPPLSMRGRYVMREYWSDSDLFRKLTAAEREVYVGLWMLSDDEGWMPRDIPAIAAALYRYEDAAPREERIRATLARLKVIGKVQSYRCGCLYLPAVARYPRAGRKSMEHGLVHYQHSKASEGRRTETNRSRDVSSRNVSLPFVARAEQPEGEPSGVSGPRSMTEVGVILGYRKEEKKA